MTRTKRQYIVRLAHSSGAVLYMDRTCAAQPSREDAHRYTSKREAESMAAHLSGVAAFRGEVGWTVTVEIY